ncbi:MAG: IclR family transcriptional regulator [Clostridiaceae bacterium]
MEAGSEKIGSIDRALDILILLYDEQRELGVTEIGASLGLYKSTVYRTLATLEKRGFVHQNPENGKYWLGMKLYSIGMAVGEKMPLKQLVQPFAKKLSQKFNEVVNVSVLDTTSGKYPRSVLIHKEESTNQVLKINPGVGSTSACYCSAVGKSLLAFSPKEVLDKAKEEEFSLYTSNTIKNWQELLYELEDIRIKGYAIDNEEQEIGLTCIAAPILNRKNMAVAAISLSGPTVRMKSLDSEEIIREVKRTVHEISLLLK